MNRRSFLQAILAAGVAPLAVAETLVPTLETDMMSRYGMKIEAPAIWCVFKNRLFWVEEKNVVYSVPLA